MSNRHLPVGTRDEFGPRAIRKENLIQMMSHRFIASGYERIAEENRQNSVSCPQYQMLDTEFFSSAYKEAEETLVQGFMLQKHNKFS